MAEYHPRFLRLVEISAPLFAGEAEVCRSYFSWAKRTKETDRIWLARQCYKEFWGSGFTDSDHSLVGDWLSTVLKMLPKIDIEIDRHEALELIEGAHAEYSHYCLFADIWDSLRAPGEPKLNPRVLANWPEGQALDGYRQEVRAKYAEGKLAWASLKFTEGGYCTLYSEGAAIKGRGGLDDQIAKACRKVYDDELGHVLNGIVAVNEHAREVQDWDLLEKLVIEQLRRRVVMRNGQFSNPLPQSRIEEIYAGKIEPIRVDLDGIMQHAA
jgi:hypothetical protein